MASPAALSKSFGQMGPAVTATAPMGMAQTVTATAPMDFFLLIHSAEAGLLNYFVCAGPGQRTPGLNVPGGVDMLSRGVMRRDPWLVLTALTPELIGGAAFLEQQMDSISSKIPYTINPAQYVQYKDGLKKEILAALPQNMSLPYIEPVAECKYEVRGYNLNAALPWQGGTFDWHKARLYSHVNGNLQPKEFQHTSNELYSYVQPDSSRPLVGATRATIIDDL